MKTYKSLVLVAGLVLTAASAIAQADPPRLVNISTRMQVLTGGEVLIGGFIIGGSLNKTVVLRARGPSLAVQGVPGVLANPQLQLFSSQVQIGYNDNWQDASNAAALQASGFAPDNAFESALLVTLAPQAYTVIVTGVGNTAGVGIVEVFELDQPTQPLLNIATRGRVLTGDDVMIAGFVIQGDGPQTVVVRARGPSLTAAGVPGVLANPMLQLFSGQTQIAVNDNWQDAANAAVLTTSGFAPSDPMEAAILVTLQPGAYTAIVTGVASTTGVAIVEVFATTLPADTQAPEVDSTSPGNTALDMSVLVPVTVTFSEPMDPSTLTTGTFTLTGPTGPVAATVSAGGNTATLTPTARLVTGTLYTANVSTGARDLAGNPLADDYTFVFTTRADEPPPIVAGCPTPAASSQLRRLEWGAPLILRRNSGEITSFRVAQSQIGRRSVVFTQGQTALTPPSPTTDLTVSRCPGVIETSLASSCRLTSTFANNLSITAVNRAPAAFGDCLAPDTEQHYVNVRWTFATCPEGTEQCGFSLTWLEGAY